MTGYVKVNSGQSGENFAWYARGGRHIGDGNPEGFEGCIFRNGDDIELLNSDQEKNIDFSTDTISNV